MIVPAAAIGALLLAIRVHPAIAAMVALSIAAPVLGLVGVVGAAGWSVWRRIAVAREQRSPEAAVLTGFAAAVGSGATVRQALSDSSSDRVSPEVKRRCSSGRPLSEVGDLIARGFPVTGAELAVVLDQSERAGSRTAAALHELAALAVDAEQRRRDVRVAAAQSRFSAVVVGVVPLLAALAVVGMRRVPEPGGPIVLAPMVMGAVLMILGSIIVFVVSGRAAS